ncbi:MAG: methyltransferase domain-containing protein [Acidobacteria bacterium]|nr:methyltransferase domain-containing protein [Acidobacteriota bacterium]
MKDLTAAIEAHYSRGPNYETILESLQQKGLPLNGIRVEDLYPYDQSHAGGIEATRMLAERGGIRPHSIVVDVGCGSGGAARYLHCERSCRVFALDLTTPRLHTALRLNQLTGNARGIRLIAASADALPLPPALADVVWTQHVTMNLANHSAFLRECSRVLKPSGSYVCHEWFRKNPGALPYPLPWAPNAALNHAVPAERFSQWLCETGFAPNAVEVTDAMCQALERDLTALNRAPASAERTVALRNLVRAANSGLLGCWMIVAPKATGTR